MTAILVPLPYLLSGLIKPLEVIIDHSHHATRVELAEEVLEEVAATALPIPIRALTLAQACALTSATLILVGLMGRVRARQASLDRRKSHGGSVNPGVRASSLLSSETLRRIFLRIVYVGLPFLAVVEIGGVRTGFILLAALASGILSRQEEVHELSKKENKTWKLTLRTRPWTCVFLVVSVVVDLVWLRPGMEISSTIRGYVALIKSVLFLQPPFPTTCPSDSKLASTTTGSSPTLLMPSTPEMNGTPWKSLRSTTVSALIHTPQDTNLTLFTGVILGFLVLTICFSAFTPPAATIYTTSVFISSVVAATILFTSSQPSSILSTEKYGLALGLSFCAVYGVLFEAETQLAHILFPMLAVLAFAAVRMDQRTLRQNKKYDTHAHTHHRLDHPVDVSKFTTIMMRTFQDWPLVRGILKEKESRRIVYFMLINLAFMFIQTFYALASGSLGLLSDSIHMFFDCIGLLAGLVAAIMSKWPPNSRFPYGYGKVETLSGLGNGIFLMIISVEIIWESFERFFEGVELKRLNELLVVSAGGLAVNLIGLVFIGHAHHGHDHGHSHSHDGHSHSHSHSHSQVTAAHMDSHAHHSFPSDLNATSLSTATQVQNHSHANENLTGIYLHILADTMGSVAVIISTLLTAYTGWSGWDPLASFLIAVLIIAASVPLVAGAAKRLMLTLPADAEYRVRSALQELSGLRGVAGYAVPRFWLDDSDMGEVQRAQGHCDGLGHSHHELARGHSHHAHAHQDHAPSLTNSDEHGHFHSQSHAHLVSHANDDDAPHHAHSHDETIAAPRILGVLHVTATRGAELEDVRARTATFMRQHGLVVVVHVEREDEVGCWCGFQSRHRRGVSTVGI